ncbi:MULTISPECIES: Lrp/AsnC family transcriptional regulator [unclassified Streptomyces]|uniref:Lrp/AsnC family transcriptional regulator n=1 Tax=unclassified Streptomyces TaxID=2593676 RepID=UPI0006F47F88|nr:MULTISPECIES: Lrp/AsnC family transcriptional regulator [unclassified Streptomyces]KQX56957.1 AsnC family transcriptional regulator [Streptomyces sp. Root1304]KRA98538.1 AsnC family transcriptional regulator [Streptomyces sp. Root66D1]
MPDRLQEYAHLDELDLSLVNTLQIDPRAPWSRIGRALDLDPVTVARRWSRLTGTGVAWITAQPGRAQVSQGCLAFVEVDCQAGRTLDVANTLAQWPHVLTVDHTSGGRDLLLTVSTPTLASLSRYLLERLGSLPGISATRTQLGTHVFTHATDWRLRALDPRQRAHITAERPPRSPSTAQTLTARDRLLIVRLGADGRTSLTDLAEELGVGITTVRNRLALLIANEDLELRCEVAQPLCGWPISTTIWAQAQIEDRDALNRLLATVPEIRACIGLAGGTANLLISVWLRSLPDIRGLEARLTGALPQLKVLDQAVSMRFVKRMGRILDPAGRSVSTVPMDIWSEPS